MEEKTKEEGYDCKNKYYKKVPYKKLKILVRQFLEN